MVALSVVIAMATAYGGLLIYLTPQDGMRLAICAVAFGLAVSGMHYTAMSGMQFVTGAWTDHMAGMDSGLEASPQILSLIIAFLCFLIAAGFLLLLMPERGQTETERQFRARRRPVSALRMARRGVDRKFASLPISARRSKLPVQSANSTQFVDVG